MRRREAKPAEESDEFLDEDEQERIIEEWQRTVARGNKRWNLVFRVLALFLALMFTVGAYLGASGRLTALMEILVTGDFNPDMVLPVFIVVQAQPVLAFYGLWRRRQGLFAAAYVITALYYSVWLAIRQLTSNDSSVPMIRVVHEGVPMLPAVGALFVLACQYVVQLEEELTDHLSSLESARYKHKSA